MLRFSEGREYLLLPSSANIANYDLSFLKEKNKTHNYYESLDQLVDQLITTISNSELKQFEKRNAIRNLSLLPSKKGYFYLLKNIGMYMPTGEIRDDIDLYDQPCLYYLTEYGIDNKEFYEVFFIILNEDHSERTLFSYYELMRNIVPSSVGYQQLNNPESKIMKNLNFFMTNYKN